MKKYNRLKQFYEEKEFDTKDSVIPKDFPKETPERAYYDYITISPNVDYWFENKSYSYGTYLKLVFYDKELDSYGTYDDSRELYKMFERTDEKELTANAKKRRIDIG